MRRAYHRDRRTGSSARQVTTRHTDGLAAAPGGRMAVDIRKGQGNVTLTREEFERRLRERFYDPEFEKVERQIADVIDAAWNAYDEYRKSPRTRKAGSG